MKVQGVDLSQPNVEEVYIPRGDKTIKFIAKGILNEDDFDKLCPRPQPPEMIKAGVGKIQNVEDPGYKQEIERYARRKTAWLYITSLRDTPGLEWEKVKYDDPGTWLEYENEFANAFTGPEIQRITHAIFAANGLSEERIKKARESFLALPQAEVQNLSFLPDGPASTSSGEPANDSK